MPWPDDVITDADRRTHDELARNLATAFAAAHFHLGLDHTYRRHIRNTVIPDYWFELAIKIERDARRSAGAQTGEAAGAPADDG